MVINWTFLIGIRSFMQWENMSSHPCPSMLILRVKICPFTLGIEIPFCFLVPSSLFTTLQSLCRSYKLHLLTLHSSLSICIYFEGKPSRRVSRTSGFFR